MDSIKDLLLNKKLDQPAELVSLERYCHEYLEFETLVRDGPRGITLIVPNGKAAYFVRSELSKIEKYCGLTKKVYIRVGATK